MNDWWEDDDAGCAPAELTPIERHGDIWIKRDDHYQTPAGVGGGKARTVWALAQGASGLVTAGSRTASLANITARIAARLGIPCRVHAPTGTLGPELVAAVAAGAEIIQHRAGYGSVLAARARDDALGRGWTHIPLLLACDENIRQTRQQVADIPAGVRRIVCPVGSGMSLAGVLHGLDDEGLHIPVVGVVVGANPTRRIDEFGPAGWRDRTALLPSGLDYHDAAPVVLRTLHGVPLDPGYEAKCVPFIQTGDLLWVVGLRATAQQEVNE
jgi:hypothetical protein